MKRKSKKKKRAGRLIFLLILIVMFASVLYLFREEISHSSKSLLKKKRMLVEKKEVLLFFSDRESEYLIGERREILRKNEVKEEAKETIAELIKGPKRNLLPTLPARTKVLTLQIDDRGMAKVNFNQALSKDHPGGSTAEMMTVYSIVNSLTLNFPQIKRVQILIDGKPIETIAGHLSLKQSVPPKPNLIKRQTKHDI